MIRLAELNANMLIKYKDTTQATVRYVANNGRLGIYQSIIAPLVISESWPRCVVTVFLLFIIRALTPSRIFILFGLIYFQNGFSISENFHDRKQRQELRVVDCGTTTYGEESS